MKIINTNLSEHEFLNRLNDMCAKHMPFDKGYSQMDVFVVKRKAQYFRIGRHFADIPLSRFDGYYKEFIYGKYTVNDSGKVDVCYRFGTPITFLIPNLIISLLAVPIFVCLLYDAIFYNSYQWGGLIVTFIFSFIGLFDLFIYSKKHRTAIKEHLINICCYKDKVNEVNDEHS